MMGLYSFSVIPFTGRRREMDGAALEKWTLVPLASLKKACE
ncbi:MULTISPECIES: hypothetical protein [unclassified Bartonella]